MEEKEKIIQEVKEGCERIRRDIEELSEKSIEDFKSSVISILKCLLAIVEKITIDYRSGQEASAQAFQAITAALKTISESLGLKQH